MVCRKKIDGKSEIEISYDPRNVSSIFIRLNNGKIEQCFLTEKFKEYEGLHLEDVRAIMKYKKDEISKREGEEKQHKAVLHAFTKNLADGAIRKTNEATEDMSFSLRQKNKRETKKSESRAVGSQKALTAICPNDKDSGKFSTAEIITFPKENQITPFTEPNQINQLFGAKNNERRRNRESLE